LETRKGGAASKGLQSETVEAFFMSYIREHTIDLNSDQFKNRSKINLFSAINNPEVKSKNSACNVSKDNKRPEIIYFRGQICTVTVSLHYLDNG